MKRVLALAVAHLRHVAAGDGHQRHAEVHRLAGDEVDVSPG